MENFEIGSHDDRSTVFKSSFIKPAGHISVTKAFDETLDEVEILGVTASEQVFLDRHAE
jgi:hypothetical protein